MRFMDDFDLNVNGLTYHIEVAGVRYRDDHFRDRWMSEITTVHITNTDGDSVTVDDENYYTILDAVENKDYEGYDYDFSDESDLYEM